MCGPAPSLGGPDNNKKNSVRLVAEVSVSDLGEECSELIAAAFRAATLALEGQKPLRLLHLR